MDKNPGEGSLCMCVCACMCVCVIGGWKISEGANDTVTRIPGVAFSRSRFENQTKLKLIIKV